MTRAIRGIHHVTAIATDPQRNVDFYAGVLGLRLVKKTVNFDDPGTYHLYYGDEEGRPGSILTFFPWPLAKRGSRGTGQATVTAFAVPQGSLPWWRRRLEGFGVLQENPSTRFDEEVLTFFDPDGLKLELVTDPAAADRPPWADGPVEATHAVRGFHGVTLRETDPEATAGVLEALGYTAAGEAGARYRFRGAGDAADPGTCVDLAIDPHGARGHVAAGTVHHVAFRAADDTDQLHWRDTMTAHGLHVTPVLDRNYFHSIYFREPGGVLFEIATDPPGFSVDEPVAELGGGLRLPPWLEPRREHLEGVLPELGPPQPGGTEGSQATEAAPARTGAA